MKHLIFLISGLHPFSDPDNENAPERPNDRNPTADLIDQFKGGEMDISTLIGATTRMFSANRFAWLTDFVEEEDECENGYWTEWFNRFRLKLIKKLIFLTR